jgi:hypothetical protein
MPQSQDENGTFLNFISNFILTNLQATNVSWIKLMQRLAKARSTNEPSGTVGQRSDNVNGSRLVHGLQKLIKPGKV